MGWMQSMNQDNPKELFEKLQGIIAEQLGVDWEAITMEANLEGLGMDSLDIIEVILAVEEELFVVIPDEDAEKMRTVADLYEYIRERIKQVV